MTWNGGNSDQDLHSRDLSTQCETFYGNPACSAAPAGSVDFSHDSADFGHDAGEDMKWQGEFVAGAMHAVFVNNYAM